MQDGGSTDGTVDMPRKYEPQILYWESKKDNGQTQALNIGFGRASGDIFHYLNADDMLLPGALASVLAYFEQHPDCDVVYGNQLIVDEHDNVIGEMLLESGYCRNMIMTSSPMQAIFPRKPYSGADAFGIPLVHVLMRHLTSLWIGI